jgi:uncharacterized membrane protein
MRFIRTKEAAAMAKTASFAGIHMTVAFGVGYAMTGDPWVGGALALVEPACNTVAYYFHERVWKRFERRPPGRREDCRPLQATT